MKFNGSNWVNLGNAGFSSGHSTWQCLQFDPTGKPCVAFNDSAFGNKARVMRYTGSVWEDIGNPGFTQGEANYTALAFSPTGIPHIAFMDQSTGGKASVMRLDTTCTIAAAGPISGPLQVCPGTGGYNYSVPLIPNATSYVWSLPNGFSITSGAGTNSVTISVSMNATAGHISVYGSGSCSGTASHLQVSVLYPLSPSVTGANDLCVNSGYYEYFTEPGMNNYQWSIAPGGIITFGQGSSTVQVVWTQPGTQWLAVSYNSATGCYSTTPTTYSVMVSPLPGQAGSITGTPEVCAGTSGVSYLITPVVNAVTYVWTLPFGASIASGQWSNSILVNFNNDALSGDVSVYGNNLCGNGMPSPFFPVTVIPVPPTPFIHEEDFNLISSAPYGNQWYRDGILLVNDTNQTCFASLAGEYWTIVTVNGCSSSASNHLFSGPVGMAGNDKPKVLIHPNPVTDFLHIDTRIPNDRIRQVEVYNLHGEIVIKTQVCSQKSIVNVEWLPDGVYFAVIRSEESVVCRKFSKF
jgi:hypothetical protein